MVSPALGLGLIVHACARVGSCERSHPFFVFLSVGPGPSPSWAAVCHCVCSHINVSPCITACRCLRDHQPDWRIPGKR